MKVVITSGYFNPLHMGHINLIRGAKKLGDILVVIVNNNEQVRLKNSTPFMPEEERIGIMKALKHVDEVVISIDKDESIAETMKMIAQKYPQAEALVFAKGGDRNIDNIPEAERKICKECGIEVVNNVGGDKVQSSSWLINKVSENQNNK